MRVRIRYFHSARVARGGSEEFLDLPEGATVASLLETLHAADPKLAGLLDRLGSSLLVAVDQVRVHRDHPLSEGSEVALLPPFSGG